MGSSKIVSKIIPVKCTIWQCTVLGKVNKID